MSRKRKPHKVVHMTPEQFAALKQYQKDMKQARPLMQETSQVARRIWEETKNAKTLRVAETAMPDGQEPPEMKPWTVGHAQVNYVDKIGQTPK
jgi:hypothetical protein